MFVICDQNDIVQDVATEENNLSRGYDFPDHKKYEDLAGDFRVGDTFKDGVLTENQEERDKAVLLQQNELKIAAKTRTIAIAECIKDGDLPPDFKDTQ